MLSDSSSQAWFGMTRRHLATHLGELSRDIADAALPHSGPITKIRHWSLASRVVPCLIGIPSSHPRIDDGSPFFTSELYFLDADRGIARSFSRWYELGEQADAAYWSNRYTGMP